MYTSNKSMAEIKMKLTPLTAISPLDGRYHSKLAPLRPIFSEYGLIYHRLKAEIHWLIKLALQPTIIDSGPLTPQEQQDLERLAENFDLEQADQIKSIEQTTNHDVKAVEYFIKEKLTQHPKLKRLTPWIHFGCTSEDINNLAYAMMLMQCRTDVLLPTITELLLQLKLIAQQNSSLAMLSRTHGQPASPTTLGKEISNSYSRIHQQLIQLQKQPISGKFNGAVGNFNAHRVAYPDVDWIALCKQFVTELGLTWNAYTTQIEPHDNLSELLHVLARINTILIDLCRDIWGYISLNYFTQQTVETEVGSSTMPHKVNPIDFENAEGNLGLANALIQHMTSKLPISRWQRDLTDSTVMRNLGCIMAYSSLAYQAIIKGLAKLSANKTRIREDLNQHWEVLAEAIQTVMRRFGIADAYEQLKSFSRGKNIDQHLLLAFVEQLNLPSEIKQQLMQLTPEEYIGYATILTENAIADSTQQDRG